MSAAVKRERTRRLPEGDVADSKSGQAPQLRAVPSKEEIDRRLAEAFRDFEDVVTDLTQMAHLTANAIDEMVEHLESRGEVGADARRECGFSLPDVGSMAMFALNHLVVMVNEAERKWFAAMDAAYRGEGA